MNDDRPELPEPSDSAPSGAPDDPRPLPPAAPWGVAGVMLGLAPVLAITLLPLLAGVTADPEALKSLTLRDRYLGFLFVQGFLAAIALTAALALRTGLAGLGLSRPRSASALFFPALGGAGLVGLATLWALGLERFAPSAYAEMMAEQAEQMGLLEAPLALLVTAAVIVAPVSEELYFRGFIYGGLRRDVSFAFASGLSAAIFAGVHLMAWSTVPLFLVGLGTAIAYERYRTLWAPVALHVAFNGAALAVELLAAPAPK